jgi:para-nitrobenzyl esterase
LTIGHNIANLEDMCGARNAAVITGCFLSWALCPSWASSQPTSPTPAGIILAAPIQVTAGAVQGMVEHGLTIYRGIPFAAPPVGDLRWRAPQPVDPWQGVLRATVFSPACMQKGPTLPGMMERYSEDCLYLNVWTPAKSATDKLAVMVYIYGGGGVSGSGSVRLVWGDQLANRGVIVVTFNYRVGAFGALAHPELTKEAGTSGNYGLLDIIAALRWVRANIAAFGGNPGNVTLFGQSAGAYWESMLMVEPEARGLFRRVIASSGGEFGTAAAKDAFPTLAQAEQSGIAYAARFGVSSVAEMRKVPATQIVAMDTEMIQGGHTSAIKHNIDGRLIPKEVRALYEDGKQAHVDLLVGSNSDEGVNTLGPLLSAHAYAADILVRHGAFAGRFLALYPGRSDPEAARSQLRAQTDDVAWRELSWARFQARVGVKHVYLYRFSTIPPFQPFARLHAAGHGAELPYVFGFPPITLLAKYEPADKAAMHTRIENQIQSYWTNFAKTGDPNGPNLPPWPSFSISNQRLLEMGDTFVVAAVPDALAMQLLDELHAEAH